ncbi:MAG: recombination protein RecR [Mycoplasmatales bacterium]|nr:recombination protein RecR [Mycoplasmatales bacterium]
MKPDSLENLIKRFNSLPGIGKKQAERIAYHIIRNVDSISESLESDLKTIRENITNCNECGNITEEEICDICTSENRERRLIVVETPMDIFKFEESDAIRPYYHVLHGLANISKNINPEDLNIRNLKERALKYKEVIIALSPNLEGIVTANYISHLLKSEGIKVTQLAQGIPLGAALEYVDEITLKSAINNRKEVE